MPNEKLYDFSIHYFDNLASFFHSYCLHSLNKLYYTKVRPRLNTQYNSFPVTLNIVMPI